MVQLGVFPKPGLRRDVRREGGFEDARGKEIFEKDRSLLEEVVQLRVEVALLWWEDGEEKLKEGPC